uniref:B-related factor 1 n=1 Tax=Mucochytrium quahogii TaxID=96639 RepID=A0A7S2W8G7_9STRA|mmetsp:Transcript_19011/g.31099  ORF Transcript_19011/g.31099 Transcript_19011/m.31099 type:complete len:541 (-) Transcript_19011:1021-2643(-)|eukprot:CAMPEP_0203762974 /NCGR_PEP_ID=MMETSP0098-20131031/15726_1 /ASSEMBLY_ACC=CAM_ASM_000208 /TAXON_ID=96639 /ORGANISM=" , Strain NY0313808BC1" /LENGTH=540 /DNA_ID=CAMNT_0050657577 /DNA_START=528 /DNA_END=2150 /DNA_ORIENTATION=-
MSTGQVGNDAGGNPRWQCPSVRCGSFNFEQTNQGIFCVDCGAVIEESNFDLSVSFSDNNDGSRSVNGQFVSTMSTTPYRYAGAGGVGFNRESREVTIANGKKRIQQLAASLKLNHFVEAAHRLFLQAVQRNFVHGRKTTNVVAACLYIVCRQRSAPTLLIDFSDILQTNVFVLGNCFLKFRRLLNIPLPAIDPVHYIDRFASKLEFEDQAHDVARTAHKLVARMKRDWIQTGRRPSGICGAALIIAARMHGFHRTQKEVVDVMKICEETLRKRLVEFQATPSGSLTVEEFLQIDLPEEADPPSFTRNREKEKLEEMKKNGELPASATSLIPLLTNGGTDEANGVSKKLGKRQQINMERAQAQLDLYSSLEAELKASLESFELQQAEKEVQKEKSVEDIAQKPFPVPRLPESVRKEKEQVPEAPVKEKAIPTVHSVKRTPEVENMPTEEEDDALFDDEIECMLLNPEESRRKKVLWKVTNKEFLEKEKQDRLEGKVKRKRKRKRKVLGPASSAAEATKNMVETKKLSKKVNYEKWKELFET